MLDQAFGLRVGQILTRNLCVLGERLFINIFKRAS
jgi:hypothetical protein